MKSTTICKKWDIVLVPFPFTDLSTSKKRPALIISPDEYNSGIDVIIAFITSNMAVKSKPGDYHIREWKQANLPKPSLIRMKLATIDKSIIVRKLGRLSQRDMDIFRQVISTFFKG
ncbi:MAG: type II toxin-antitoxin system PemK/MazF family toxin [Desulfotignum sp.]|nr:type II toxin-antitoxin system PemK/MazF family toxin [Desulfotignum sp.]